jgi:hypothetical protein
MHQSADLHLLARAERHVREGKERVVRQLAYIRELEMRRDLPAAEQAKRLLVTMQHSLEQARDDLAHATLNRRATSPLNKPISAAIRAEWPSNRNSIRHPGQ